MSAVRKEALYRLIDALPESEHDTAARVLTALSIVGGDRSQYSLDSAPFDDEDDTLAEEESRTLQEARSEADAGKRIPAKVIFDRFGV